jgi:hypothetical protein
MLISPTVVGDTFAVASILGQTQLLMETGEVRQLRGDFGRPAARDNAVLPFGTGTYSANLSPIPVL